MKKSNFTALMMGTVSMMFFGMGMCMTTQPQWNAFKPGCVMGLTGLLLGLVTIGVWRRMEHKAPVKISAKTVFNTLIGIIGAMALGIGMCFTMVWGNLILGVVIGMIGILTLLCLIPVCIGIK